MFANEENVVIAKLDANEAVNKPVAQRYGVTGFPTIKFFGPDSKEEPTAYEGGRDLSSLVAAVNEAAGTSRQDNGRLGDGAGRIEALDAIAAKVAGGDEGAVTEMAEEAAKIEGELCWLLCLPCPFRSKEGCSCVYGFFSFSCCHT